MNAGPVLFDRAAIARSLRRAQRLGPATFLIDRVAEDFGDRLATVLRHFELAADIGSPTDAVRRRLRRANAVSKIVALLPPGAVLPTRDGELTAVADPEALPLRDNRFDLVFSALALQSVNELPGTFIQIE